MNPTILYNCFENKMNQSDVLLSFLDFSVPSGVCARSTCRPLTGRDKRGWGIAYSQPPSIPENFKTGPSISRPWWRCKSASLCLIGYGAQAVKLGSVSWRASRRLRPWWASTRVFRFPEETLFLQSGGGGTAFHHRRRQQDAEGGSAAAAADALERKPLSLQIQIPRRVLTFVPSRHV